MSKTRKSVLFEASEDISLDFGGGSGASQNQYGASHPHPNHTQSHHSGMDFFNPAQNSDFMGAMAGDFLMRKGMEGLYGNLSGRMNQYQSYFDYLRCYFDVDNSYVMRKLSIILFPFRQTKWSRTKQSSAPDNFATSPSDEHTNRNLNEPDLYIPIMTFISYILLVGAVMGQKNQFEPDKLAALATWRIFFWLAEMLVIRLGFYFFGLDTVSFLDALAFSGYKFVGILLTTVGTLFGGSYAYYPLWIFTSVCMAIFLIKTLRTAAIHSDDPGMRIKMDSNLRTRNWFLFIICIIQLPIMYWFSRNGEKIFFMSRAVVEPLMTGSGAQRVLEGAATQLGGGV